MPHSQLKRNIAISSLKARRRVPHKRKVAIPAVTPPRTVIVQEEITREDVPTAEQAPLNLGRRALALANVGELLALSRAAHQRYYGASPRIDSDGVLLSPGNINEQIAAIRAALDARREAQGIDPAHHDAAWALDQAFNRGATTDQLLMFYTRFLDRHP